MTKDKIISNDANWDMWKKQNEQYSGIITLENSGMRRAAIFDWIEKAKADGGKANAEEEKAKARTEAAPVPLQKKMFHARKAGQKWIEDRYPVFKGDSDKWTTNKLEDVGLSEKLGVNPWFKNVVTDKGDLNEELLKEIFEDHAELVSLLNDGGGVLVKVEDADTPAGFTCEDNLTVSGIKPDSVISRAGVKVGMRLVAFKVGSNSWNFLPQGEGAMTWVEVTQIIANADRPWRFIFSPSEAENSAERQESGTSASGGGKKRKSSKKKKFHKKSSKKKKSHRKKKSHKKKKSHRKKKSHKRRRR